ncbi:MAG TPA: GAF domain-containing protein, partial [Anaerolineales bacterium]|nr:GAF domain-containing protein [Anaerolineales bacterium]
MSSSFPQKVHLISALSISLLSQGFLLVPERLSYILQDLPSWASVAFGAALLVLSAYLNLLWIRSVSVKNSVVLLSNTLLFIQLFSVTGIYFIAGSNRSGAGDAGFLLTCIITALTNYGIFLSAGSRAGLNIDLIHNVESTSDLDTGINTLNEQINSLTRQLAAEKHRTSQLILLNELSQQLEAELDPPVAAQLAVNTLERAINCSLVLLMMHEAEKQEFVVMAAAGKMTGLIPSGYRQASNSGLLGRTKRIKKTQIINDSTLDPDFLPIDNTATIQSIISVPILHQGHVKGVLEISSEKTFAFNSLDAALAEDIASELMRAWDRSGYQQRLT